MTESRSPQPAPERQFTAVREIPLGPVEVAELLKVKRATVDQWLQRGVFCAPDMRVSGRPLWWRDTCLEWARATGRL